METENLAIIGEMVLKLDYLAIMGKSVNSLCMWNTLKDISAQIVGASVWFASVLKMRIKGYWDGGSIILPYQQ